MDLAHKLLFTALLLFATVIDGTKATVMVSGSVFCDQCKDGKKSLFDYPLSGIKVTLTCADGNGQVTMSREETTNMFGTYVMKFDGTSDLSNCNAQVSGRGQQSHDCGATAGPAQKLGLKFKMFGMEMYGVDSLLSAPAQPKSFCPRSGSHVLAPVTTPTLDQQHRRGLHISGHPHCHHCPSQKHRLAHISTGQWQSTNATGEY